MITLFHLVAMVDAESLSTVSLFATFGLWLRVEHRLTKLESKLKE